MARMARMAPMAPMARTRRMAPMVRMAPMGNGSGLLILTVTRACNLRCSYCPTAKDGWPSLTVTDAKRALGLFVGSFGGGDVKIFGGEPLLVPDVVRAAMDLAATEPAIRWIQLSTNGLGLDDRWLAYLDQNPKAVLAVSLDGEATDHRRFRRSLPGVADSYSRIRELVPKLVAMRRVVTTQTIPPAGAARAAQNFRHLLELGFFRFNFLPGYYLPWSDAQLGALRDAFSEIAELVRERWQAGKRVHVRNLFTLAATPFFNTGLVVDSDRSIHPSNLGLSASLDHLRTLTQVGTLDAPPSSDLLGEVSARVPMMLEQALSPEILGSTRAADAELTRFCRSLYPSYLEYRRRRAA
ncbi:MAG TPA: radical SAM protein [Polyangiaceae bacterium]|nr:radical SAM protein [Polyangiaceae bacterium]